MTPTNDIQTLLLSDMEAIRDRPEGVTVEVLTADEALARRAGPMVAERLFPGRRFSDVLHMERAGSSWLVTVRDRGPIYPPRRGTG